MVLTGLPCAGVRTINYFCVCYQTALSTDVKSYLISMALNNDTSQGQDVLCAAFLIFETGLLLSQPLTKGNG